MINIKSLLKKIELFEKLATYGSRKEFLKSLGQSELSFADKKFSEARKFLQMSKEAIQNTTGDLYLLSSLGNDIVSAYMSIRQAPLDISTLKEQLVILNYIRDAMYAQGKGDVNNPSTKISLNMSNYLKLVSDSLKDLSGESFEETLINTPLPETPKYDVGSKQWAGKATLIINPKAQSSLNELFNLSLKVDGSLGPQTAQALQMYKNKYKNTKNVYDPSLHQDVINTVEDKKSGLSRITPF